MDLERKVLDVQMLKFGRAVDLEKLERVGSNKIADELRDRLSLLEQKCVGEVQQLDVRFAIF